MQFILSKGISFYSNNKKEPLKMHEIVFSRKVYFKEFLSFKMLAFFYCYTDLTLYINFLILIGNFH